MHLSKKTLCKVTAQPFVQNKGFSIIQQLSNPKESVDLMKGELSIKLVYFT